MSDLPTFGPYRAVEKLGEGGNCTVWRCVGDGAEVAVKALMTVSDEDIGRFAREAELLGQIDHPNVIRVHGIDVSARPPWLVMDLMSGRDLDEERQEGPLEPEAAARLIADVAGGLAAVHALGVRHRDIKPANVMRGLDGVPRLIDFGIARHVQESHKTRQGFVVGTAAYLAPEVFFGDDPQKAQDTEAADVYALGQTLCEILTGEPIYDREGDTTLMVRIMKDKLERPYLDPTEWRPVPAGLAAVVRAATRMEPEDRLQTAEELRERLLGWLEERRSGSVAPVSAALPKVVPSVEVERSSSGAIAAGGGLAVVALLAVVTALGVGGLWALRPVPFDIRGPIVAAAPSMARCGAVTDELVVVIAPSGSVRVTDPGRTTPATQRCLVDALQALDLHPPTDTPIPLHLQGSLHSSE